MPLVSEQANGKTDAVMPICFSRYFGVTMIRQPPFTAYSGPWIAPIDDPKQSVRYRMERKAMCSIIQKIPHCAYFYQHFRPECANWYPFYLQGFEQTTRYTFRLGTGHDILGNIRSETRRKIKRGLEGIQSEVLDSWDEGLSLFACTLNRHYSGRRAERHLRILIKLMQVLQARNHLILFGVRHKLSGKLLNVHAVAHDQKRAGLILTGQRIDPNFPNLHVSALYELGQWAQARRLELDLEGSMHPGLERVYRAMGAVQTPYFQIKKINNKALGVLARILDI